jgi:hypothetical protein
MDRLEDPDGVEAADLGARVEQAMEGPILGGRREPASSGEAAASGTLDSGS